MYLETVGRERDPGYSIIVKVKTLFVFDIRGVSTKKQNEILLGIFEMSQAEEDGKMHSSHGPS